MVIEPEDTLAWEAAPGESRQSRIVPYQLLASFVPAIREETGEESRSFFTALAGGAQDAGADAGGSALSPYSVRAGLGFAADPSAFLLTAELDYHIHDMFTVGPLLQYGVADDRTWLMPSINLQYIIDLTPISETLGKFKPFLQAGTGFAYIHKERGRDNLDDVGFLINLGFGGDYYLNERFAVGSNMLFNIMPDDVIDENFIFSWQVLTARFHF